MSDTTITGNYKIIDTKGMEKPLIKKQGINDTNSLNDNVLDISDSTRLKEELNINPKDVSKIKFVKIDSTHYIDLSNPQQRADLINKLKANILEKGQVKDSFSNARFEENTGLVLDFEKSNQIGASISRATQIMDNITRSLYDTDMKNPKIFEQVATKLTEQIKAIDKALETLKADPVANASEIDKLKKIKTLALSIKDVYQFIGNSNKIKAMTPTAARKEMQQISAQLLVKTRAITSALDKLTGGDIGKNNYLKITDNLIDLTELSNGYLMQAAVGNASTDLSRFTLQSYERIREIKAKERIRDNETPDMKGAIQSYANDNTDMAEFMRQIAIITANIGSYNSKEAAVNAISKAINAQTLSKLKGGFADGAKNLIAGRWEVNVAQKEVKIARQRANEGRSQGSEANRNLQVVTGSKNADGTITEGLLQKAGRLYELSEDKRFKHNEPQSRELLRQVRIETQQVQIHLNEYKRLKSLENYSYQDAENHLALANAAANRAKGHAQQVLQGNYVKELGPQAKEIIGMANQIKAESDSIMSDIKRLREAATQTDQIAANANKANNSISIRVEARELLDNKIDDIRKNVSEQIKDKKDMYGIPTSKELVDFLANPDKPIPSEQREKYLNELKGVIEDHPEIAKTYSDKLMSLKTEMEKIITQKAGGDPVLATVLRNEMLDGLLSSQAGLIYQASTANFKPDQDSRIVTGGLIEPNYMKPVQQWLLETRKNLSTQMLNQNDDTKNSFNTFNQVVKNDPEMQAKYQEFLNNHPHNGEAESVSMSLDFNQGFVMNFDVKMVKDNKSGEYCVFNPYDGGVYKGKTAEEAMKNFADNSHLGDGILNYKGTKGNIISTNVKAPESSLGMDLLMGGAGLLGGILAFAPDPTLLTKLAAGGLITASSAHFMYKGGTELYNLYQTERNGWNRETFFATLDLATGFLGVLDGAGIALQATKAGSTVLKTSAALAEGTNDAVKTGSAAKTIITDAEKLSMAQSMVKKYVEFTVSKGFNTANLGLSLSDATMSTASRIYDISKMNISKEDKAIKIAEALASMAVPIGIAMSSHAIMRAKSESDFIKVASKELDNVTTSINQARLNPITAESLKESLTQLEDLEKTVRVRSNSFRDPKVGEIAMQKINGLKEQVQNLMKQGEMISNVLKDSEVQRLNTRLDEVNGKFEKLVATMDADAITVKDLRGERKSLGDRLKETKGSVERQSIIDQLKVLNEKIGKIEKNDSINTLEKKSLAKDLETLGKEREDRIVSIAPKQEFPIGFKDKADFQKAVDTYKDVSCVKDFATDNPVIGVRGSSIYGLSPYKGTAFNPKSDIDFFMVSDNLFNEGIRRLKAAGIDSNDRNFVRGGYLTQKGIAKAFPEFNSVDEAVSGMIGRKSGIRIMTKEAFEKLQTGKEVIGQ